MSVNIPPNPNVSTFNNLYWTQADDALTTGEADLRYLKFPIAQGTENLAAINVNGVATFNSTMNTGGVLQITQNGTTGVKILNTQTGSAAQPPISGRTDFFNEDTTGAEVNSAMIDYSGLHTGTLNTFNHISGTLNICPNIARAAPVNIATGTNATNGCIVNIGNGNSSQSIIRMGRNNLFDLDSTSGALSLSNVGLNSGAINIGSGTNSTGDISIGNAASSGASAAGRNINIGRGDMAGSSVTRTLNIGNPVNISGLSTTTTNIGKGNAIQVVSSSGASTIAMNGATTFNQGIQINTASGILISGTDTTDGFTSVVKVDAYKSSATQAGGQIGIGSLAGISGQGINGIGIGSFAGNTNQGQAAIAIGNDCAFNGQGASSVAIGNLAANQLQRTNCVAIGNSAGQFSQGSTTSGSTGGCVAIGQNAGRGTGVGADFQQPNAVAVGLNAGNTNQGINSVAMGSSAGTTNQGTNSTAIGCQAGQTSQGNSATAVGINAGQQNQGAGAVCIGDGAGFFGMGAVGTAGIGNGVASIAIGRNAGFGTSSGVGGQSLNAIAIGNTSGNVSQGEAAVAVGTSAGQTSQGGSCVAVGVLAGAVSQVASAVAIGSNAGRFNQAENAIAIGPSAGIGQSGGTIFQGTRAIAIGASAGAGTTSGQGTNAIAIGAFAGQASQSSNSICLNASGSALNPSQQGFFVNPVRTTTATADTIVTYDTTTRELTSTSVLTGFAYLQEVEDPMLSRVGRAGGLVGYTYDPAFVTNISAPVTTNRTFLMASYFYAGQVITSLGVVANATTIAVGSNLQLGLYTGAGALVASTAVLTNSSAFVADRYTFFAVNSSVPYTIPTSGFYYFAIGAGATAPTTTFLSVNPPGMINYPNTAAITTGAISNLRFGVFTTAGTYMPSSLNTISVTNNSGILLVAAI